MRGVLAAAVLALVTMQSDKVVPVHEEPRHHLVFETPGTRILDVQIVPGDTTLFHTHSNPILYVTISTSKTSSQVAQAPSAPVPAPGAPAPGPRAPAPGAPAPGTANAPSAPGAPGDPPGRLMSVTSYFEQPLTHRVTNHGPSLFRLIGITNESLGDQSDGASAGFDGTPELTNRWFRGYRLALTTTTPTGRHRHPNPVAIVAVAGSATVDAEGAATRALAQPGAFGYVAANVAHTLRATSPDAQVQEIEIRHPR